jgi:hypothetical protein
LNSPEKYSQQLEKIRSNHKTLLDQNKNIWAYEQTLIFKMRDYEVDDINNIRKEDAFLKLQMELQQLKKITLPTLKEERKDIMNSLKMSEDDSISQFYAVHFAMTSKSNQKSSQVPEKKLESDGVFEMFDVKRAKARPVKEFYEGNDILILKNALFS